MPYPDLLRPAAKSAAALSAPGVLDGALSPDFPVPRVPCRLPRDLFAQPRNTQGMAVVPWV